MRIGTFWCWLFGHLFLLKSTKMVYEDGYEYRMVTRTPVRFCIRCGNPRDEQ